MRPIDGIEEALDPRVEALGFEVVELEWGGTERRPILRLRVDRPDSSPGQGVTVQDCARVSRALEPWLDEYPGLPERYVLEVSSPGVERPLVRERDFRRFAGQEVRLRVAESGRRRTEEGILVGIEAVGEGSAYAVRVRRGDGSEVAFPRESIQKARLVFRWEDEER